MRDGTLMTMTIVERARPRIADLLEALKQNAWRDAGFRAMFRRGGNGNLDGKSGFAVMERKEL